MFEQRLGAAWLDAERLSAAELEEISGAVVLERLSPVWVRHDRRWIPVVLTGWCTLGGGRWAARVQTGPDVAPVWLRYRGASIQPVPPILEGLPPGDLTAVSAR
jgi:hypothetical protein